MKSSSYESQEFLTFLESLQQKKFTGIVQIDARIENVQKQRSRILAWHNGQIVYGGSKLPTNQEFAKTIGNQLKPSTIELAIEVGITKINNKDSIRELLELLIRMRLFSWEAIENIVEHQIVLILEQLNSYSGTFNFEHDKQFDLCFGDNRHGVKLINLIIELEKRQQEWATFSSEIKSIDSIPYIVENGLKKVTDRGIYQHLNQWVDGKKTLTDIAEGIDKDPLQIARAYFNWVQLGWIKFKNNTEEINFLNKKNKDNNLPIILSVDDSPIVQKTINKFLEGRYQILLASNAVDALNMIYNNPIALVLLDVTMPDIDGLDMCRTLRSIPKFRNLPIIMLTAKDGLIDKLKGQIAGSTQYLTKPFEKEELLEIIDKYVNSKNDLDRTKINL